jgi:thioredoxin 1
MEAEGLAVEEITKEIGITRMDCPTCIITLEKSVMKVSGVSNAQGNYLKKTLKVTYDKSTPLLTIEKAIEDVGYQVSYKKYPNPISRIQGLFSRDKPKAITVIADNDFPEKVLNTQKPVTLLFSSETCPSCLVFKPQYKELAKKEAGRGDFYEMDIANTETWKDYEVNVIPTIIIFRGGKPVERFNAVIRIDELEKTLLSLFS